MGVPKTAKALVFTEVRRGGNICGQMLPLFSSAQRVKLLPNGSFMRQKSAPAPGKTNLDLPVQGMPALCITFFTCVFFGLSGCRVGICAFTSQYCGQILPSD